MVAPSYEELLKENKQLKSQVGKCKEAIALIAECTLIIQQSKEVLFKSYWSLTQKVEKLEKVTED